MTKTAFLQLASTRNLELAQLVAVLNHVKPAVVQLWSIAYRATNGTL